ncbi:tetratricopeptide repeat protein [Halonatronum saccharophilum]|uniref:tetratricopeptide repeat protein n=1 Tax=Halonatronum saccharophilum TaxID=150060 RepID=UPI000484BE54|nr:tetratricopeptide repeat protein [Halonatronum saccharophilum]
MRKVLFFFMIILVLYSSTSFASSRFEEQWQEALRINEDLRSESGEENIVLDYQLAVIYANFGKIEDSMDVLQSIDKSEGREKLRDIIPEYEERFSINPLDIVNSNYLAFAYYIVKDYEKAREVFTELSYIDDQNIWTYNYLAVVEHQLEDYDKAHKTLERSLEIEDNEYTHFLLGVNYYKNGSYFRAMNHIRRGRRGVRLFLD